MSTNAPLRKSLRKVPDFVSLSGREMDVICDQMICREYKSGDVIWRTKSRLDFIGVIQNGEIVVDHWVNGSIANAINLRAGDFIGSSNLTSKEDHAVILARAATDVRLYILQKQQHVRRNSSQLKAGNNPPDHSRFVVQWNKLFAAIVVILIGLLSWEDLSRLLSGGLYLRSNWESQVSQDYQSSIRLLDFSESIDYGAVFPYNERGYIWYLQGDLSQAESFFKRALAIDQFNASALNNLGVVYFSKGGYQQAFPIQKKAAQVAPDNSIIRYNLGVVLMQRGMFEEAMREFKESSRIDPNWDLPFLQIAYIHVQLQDHAAAEKAATVAINLNFSQQSSHLLLAIALYNQGKDVEALKAVENALQISPHDHVSRFYRALILANLSEVETALSELQRLLETINDPKQIDRINLEINNLHDRLQTP